MSKEPRDEPKGKPDVFTTRVNFNYKLWCVVHQEHFHATPGVGVLVKAGKFDGYVCPACAQAILPALGD